MDSKSQSQQTEIEEKYIIYIPFTISGNFEFKLEDGVVNLPEPYLTLELKEQNSEWKEYSIKVSGFENSEEATSYFGKLQGVLYWIALQNKVGISIPENLSEIQIFKQPIPIDPTNPFAPICLEKGWTELDGAFDGRKAVVYSNNLRLMMHIGGHASFTIGIPQRNIQKYLDEANALKSLERVCLNENLKLAIELYSANQFESTPSIKLIQYISILEILFKIDSDENIKKIKRLKKLVEYEISKVIKLQYTKDPVSVVESAYKLRSILVHGDAKAEDFIERQNEAMTFLDEFIKSVLQRRFIEEANTLA